MACIAIIGTGRMAQGLGRGWARVGHTIIFGSRSPERKAHIAAQVEGAQVTDAPEALDGANIVVMAIPYGAVESFAHDYSLWLQGKLVIDISNPSDHLPDNRISGAEITARAIGSDAHVVAAFKANFWQTLLEPVDPSGVVRDVHFAGGNAGEKQIVSQLIQDLSFCPVDCGPLSNARVLDAMAQLIVELDMRYARDAHKASWKLLS
jgi:predicted dinucleotide-binding enzyme